MTNTDQDKPANPSTIEPPEVCSRILLNGAKSVVIRHEGEAYRLILTRNNRLILQK